MTTEVRLGTCHGPGCCRPQAVLFWCSEECQGRWEERWGKRLPEADFGRLRGDVFDVHVDTAQAETVFIRQIDRIDGFAERLGLEGTP